MGHDVFVVEIYQRDIVVRKDTFHEIGFVDIYQLMLPEFGVLVI
jgi:hypothetical protein